MLRASARVLPREHSRARPRVRHRLRTRKSAPFRPHVLPVAGRVSHRAFDIGSDDACVRLLGRQCVRGRALRATAHLWPQERSRAWPRARQRYACTHVRRRYSGRVRCWWSAAGATVRSTVRATMHELGRSRDIAGAGVCCARLRAYGRKGVCARGRTRGNGYVCEHVRVRI